MKTIDWLKATTLVLGLSGLTVAAFLWCQYGVTHEEALEVGPRSVILFGERAKPLFRQCSRSSPAQVSGFWSPTAEDIKRLELVLPSFLTTQRKKDGQPINLDVNKFANYYKQYTGFSRSGKRFIYVNANSQTDVNWLHEAIVMCDGGEISFGTEYDMKSGQFSEFHFNGSL